MPVGGCPRKMSMSQENAEDARFIEILASLPYAELKKLYHADEP